MFGIGMPELLLILAVALIVIGPKKLPDLAKSLGKAMGEFKRATSDLKQSIEKETGLDEVRKNIRETGKEIRGSLNPVDANPFVRPEPAQPAGDVRPSDPTADAPLGEEKTASTDAPIEPKSSGNA